VEWEPDAIRWYVDDVLFMTRTSAQWYSDGAPANPRAPFDQDFYLILNTAIGGWYTGCTEPFCVTADLPQQFLVDYVRVYEDIVNVPPTVAITAPGPAASLPAGDITITATAADTDGSIATVEFYNGATYLGDDATAPYAFTWHDVADGCYTIVARAIDDLGGFATDAVDVTVGAGCGQAAFPGSPFALPTRIQAEDFDVGGAGVAYQDTDPGNNGGQYRPAEDVDIETCYDSGGGYNVGWIDAGEWLEYTIDVPEAGGYTINARVSSLLGGGSFRLEFDGVDRTGDVVVPATSGWQTWTSVSATAALPAGQQVMRLVATAAGFNVNYVDILSGAAAVPSELRNAGYALNPCYPNPFNPVTTISYDIPVPVAVRLTVHDVSGRLVRTLVAAETVAAGRHEVVWDGRDRNGRVVAAGVYLYRLTAGEYLETRRMTLVK
jgi:hypothetical protein